MGSTLALFDTKFDTLWQWVPENVIIFMHTPKLFYSFL